MIDTANAYAALLMLGALMIGGGLIWIIRYREAMDDRDEHERGIW